MDTEFLSGTKCYRNDLIATHKVYVVVVTGIGRRPTNVISSIPFSSAEEALRHFNSQEYKLRFGDTAGRWRHNSAVARTWLLRATMSEATVMFEELLDMAYLSKV